MTQHPTKPTLGEWRERFEKLIWQIDIVVTTVGVENIKDFIQAELVRVVEEIKIKLPKMGAYQYFPQKDNPVRCRLCNEKIYCTCSYGYDQAITDLEAKKKEIVNKIKKLEGKL